MKFAELVFWTVALLGGMAGRFAGSWVGRRVGARYAVAWSGALAGFTATVVLGEALMHVATRPGWGTQDWKNNLKDFQLAGCMVYGAIWASIIEGIAIFIELVRASASPDTLSPPRPRSFRFQSVLVVSVLACLLYADYRVSLMPWLQRCRTKERIQNLVDSLKQRRPQGVTKGQWVWVVGWTHNGVDESFFMPSSIKDDERYYRFVDELERRIQGKVDMSTIDWIWDEFELIGPSGKSYSQKYRPTTPEHFREAGPLDFGFDVP